MHNCLDFVEPPFQQPDNPDPGALFKGPPVQGCQRDRVYGVGACWQTESVFIGMPPHTALKRYSSVPGATDEGCCPGSTGEGRGDLCKRGQG